jgi:hypothetical protein
MVKPDVVAAKLGRLAHRWIGCVSADGRPPRSSR